MQQAQFVLADLGGQTLALTHQNVVTLDPDAAGYGWFVDPTPNDNSDYQPAAAGASSLQAIDPQAVDRIDLLTVVEHELGHVAGLLDDSPATSSMMAQTLPAGTRRLIEPADIDALLAIDGVS